MIKIANNKFVLYNDNSITVKCHKVANRLNRHLNYYKDYHFSPDKGDEPVFKFVTSDLPNILRLLKGPL